jgi:hypothetical protein
MAIFTRIDNLFEHMAEKVHNLQSDTLKVALTNTAPSSSNTVLANITEITYTNLSARTITVTSSSTTAGVYKLVLTDLVLTASGSAGPFRYAVIYNDTATNKELLGFFDYGSSISLNTGETITLDFDGTNGIFTIA